MVSLPPEYIVAVVKFKPIKGRSKAKRLLLKLPEKVGGNALLPLYFAYINNPVRILGRTYFAAIGAVAIYRLSAADANKQLYDRIKEILEKSKCIEEFRVIGGYDMDFLADILERMPVPI